MSLKNEIKKNIEDKKTKVNTLKGLIFNKKERFRQKELKSVFDELGYEISEYQVKYYQEAKKLKEAGHPHFAMVELEDKILKAIEEDEELLTVIDNMGRNIGINSAYAGLDNVVKRCLDSFEASTQKDKLGKNIGMIAGQYCSEECAIKALDNETASIQQDNSGLNIGMYCAMTGFKKATLKAIDNEEATKMQEENGYSIGLFSATYGMDECAVKVLDLYPECLGQITKESRLSYNFLANYRNLPMLKDKVSELYEKISDGEMENPFDDGPRVLV